MVLGGLWHGANDNFISWGFYHGMVLVVYRICAQRGMRWPWENSQATLLVRRLVMFHLWCVGCMIFRATSTEHALFIFTEMFSFAGLTTQFFRQQWLTSACSFLLGRCYYFNGFT